MSNSSSTTSSEPIHLWLRAETKANERRTPLTPENARRLVEAGFQLSVERSTERPSAYSDEAYEAAGCTLVDSLSWHTAPADAIILGLKELPEVDEDDEQFALTHTHIFFCHCFKEQDGWQKAMRRFVDGNGLLYDLEFLTHENGRRVAAFGRAAGFAGAALSLKYWCVNELARLEADSVPAVNTMGAASAYDDQQQLVDELKELLDQVAQARKERGMDIVKPSVMIMGARGRCGSGARDLCTLVGLGDDDVVAWDMEETKQGGPFPQILESNVFINAIYLQNKIPPFLDNETVLDNQDSRKLSIICDVSCDTTNPNNPLPFANVGTTFDEPANRVQALSTDTLEFDVISIDHLPSLLPLESSNDYSDQLIDHLLDLPSDPNGVWQRAKDKFDTVASTLPAQADAE